MQEEEEGLLEFPLSPTAKFQKTYQKLLKWHPPEGAYDDIEPFDINQAWEALLTLPSCQQVMIKTSSQKRLNLVVGVNVTEEFPWKQIPYRHLRSYLFDDLPRMQFFHDAFYGYKPDNHVLLGYMPTITQNMEQPPEGDPFILYVHPEDAKLALNIIRNIETYERLYYNKKLIKKPREWISHGSEREICIEQFSHEPVNVEIQSIYPLTIPVEKEFSLRLSTDVRDGYVQLVPADGVRFDNIIRKRITVGIQSSSVVRTIEQQTDPAFPSNAWAQYLYEINEDDADLDPDSEEEENKLKTKQQLQRPVEKKIIEVSNEIKFLLQQLEFNQIDMYRNDYEYITNFQVVHHIMSELKETLCFANISKSFQRYVSCCDWYPTMAGLIVTSYAFSTPCTTESVQKKVDYVQQAVLQPNPILMWSFSDNLNYKLEFESPREVTALSFCPYDPNILIGGTINGQLYLWDLQNRVEKIDQQETLSTAQTNYRLIMNDFLKWTIQVDEDIKVAPAIISHLESSQKSPITGIHWIDQHFFINVFGKVYKNPSTKMKYRYFITSSMDGTIAFWNLDATANKKIQSIASSRRNLPKALTQSESTYKGKILKPIFTIAYSEPITAVIADTSVFKCIVKDITLEMRKNSYNYPIELQAVECPEVRQSMVISTFCGRIEHINWQGLYVEGEGKEVILHPISFARVHDGPIVAMKKNPFLPWLFASIGRRIFAVWKESYNYSPIFWRKRQCDLTALAWSESCPNILYLTRSDGGLEAWNILVRDDDAQINDVLGGGTITAICEHRPVEPEKLMGIGDYNSSLRMIRLPKCACINVLQNTNAMIEYISNEESRKKDIQAMEQNYYENNREFIENKRHAAMEAHREMERIEKEQQMLGTKSNKQVEENNTTSEPVQHMSYTLRMKHQWYELNLHRLLSILMSRKRVNEKKLKEDTAMEKERLAYEAAKKAALVEVLQNVANELANVRLQIYPEEIPDLQRSDMIENNVMKILAEANLYEENEEEARHFFESYDGFQNIEYAEFLDRGEKRRMNLNKSLGGNTERLLWYDNIFIDNQLSECLWFFAAQTDTILDEIYLLNNSEMTVEEEQTEDDEIENVDNDI